jgi:hypothetical protein
MSISPLNGVSQASVQTNQTRAVTSIPPATSFGQELDSQGTKTGLTHGHHHHGGATQSPTASAATASATAGVAPANAIASALQHLLS